MVNVAALGQKPLEGFDLAQDTVSPRKFEQATRNTDEFVSHGKSPFRILAAIAIPNLTKAPQTLRTTKRSRMRRKSSVRWNVIVSLTTNTPERSTRLHRSSSKNCRTTSLAASR